MNLEEYERANEIIAQNCRDNFFDFVKTFWDVVVTEPMIYGWHLEYISAELQKVGELIIARQPYENNLLINVPPGTSKTTLCTILFPAWLWTRDPSLRILTGSYSIEIAIDSAIKSRDIFVSELYETLYPGHIVLKPDQNNKTNYMNNKNGQRVCCSVGGSVMGRHAHAVILDDPIKREEAMSQSLRESAIKWYKETIPSRKVEKWLTPIITVMQRLHEGDPSAEMLNVAEKVGKLKHICLPAELTDLDNVKPKRLERYYKDSLLDPVRLNKDSLKEQREFLGSVGYAGQYLQSPMEQGGNMVNLEDFELYDELPEEGKGLVVSSWDPNVKEKEQNDPTAGTCWAVYPNGYYCTDIFNKNIGYTELKATIQKWHEIHNENYVLIEDKANGSPAIEELQRGSLLPIVPINPHKDKVTRFASCTPLIEAKKVFLPKNHPLTRILITQLCGFPNVTNDDLVDSVSQFLNYIKSKSYKIPKAVTSNRQRQKIKSRRSYEW